MIASDPKVQSVQDAVDRIRIVRPWIEINPHFMRDLHLFRAILVSADAASLSKEQQLALNYRSFPRLDFGANLVNGILQGTKTITMRLLSDVEDDHNSDLGSIFPYSLVAATSNSASLDGELESARFAYLRIDQCDTKELEAIDPTTLRKSGFESTNDVLSVLQQFYPTVTTTTPLIMFHFQLICVC
ncbi:hypothetical protein BBJ28_00001236 [Nothophytophthora sp. Chile5]|nr:hypothetical protein BBJ28_00001236 [Nothophytophthora sp. Chile5]